MSTNSPTSFHNFWGSFDYASNLPNVYDSSLQDSGLEEGDTAYIRATQSIYVCSIPTIGAALWVQAGSTSVGPVIKSYTVVGNVPAGDTASMCDYLDTGNGAQLAVAISEAAGTGNTVYVRPGSYNFSLVGGPSDSIVITGCQVIGQGFDSYAIWAKGALIRGRVQGQLELFNIDDTGWLIGFHIYISPPIDIITGDAWIVGGNLEDVYIEMVGSSWPPWPHGPIVWSLTQQNRIVGSSEVSLIFNVTKAINCRIKGVVFHDTSGYTKSLIGVYSFEKASYLEKFEGWNADIVCYSDGSPGMRCVECYLHTSDANSFTVLLFATATSNYGYLINCHIEQINYTPWIHLENGIYILGDSWLVSESDFIGGSQYAHILSPHGNYAILAGNTIWNSICHLGGSYNKMVGNVVIPWGTIEDVGSNNEIISANVQGDLNGTLRNATVIGVRGLLFKAGMVLANGKTFSWSAANSWFDVVQLNISESDVQQIAISYGGKLNGYPH